tara:strand:- start:928 stop:1239 length:312 start_codon:yes stop_codon:yes gene_type:complete
VGLPDAYDDFAKLVNTGNQSDAKIEIIDMKITGNAANAAVAISWSEQGENGYIDHLNLIFGGSSWRVTAKVHFADMRGIGVNAQLAILQRKATYRHKSDSGLV